MYQTRGRLCLTRDGTRAVREGDPDGYALLAPAGAWLPDAVARRYKLAEVEGVQVPAAPPQPEQAAPPAPDPTGAAGRAIAARRQARRARG